MILDLLFSTGLVVILRGLELLKTYHVCAKALAANRRSV